MREVKRLGIQLESNCGIKELKPLCDQLEIHFLPKERKSELFDKVIVATGGSPRRSGLEWLEALSHLIEEPVPSLFSFNMPDEAITRLMGIVIEPVQVNLQGTKIKADGALLVTHWGMSGPAILKLSSYGARLMNELNYKFTLQINWVNQPNSETVINALNAIIDEHGQKQLINFRPYGLPERLWSFLLAKSDLPADKRWNELGKKGINKLMNILTNDCYVVNGQSAFKEEFVTCGGVSLQSVDLNTMQSKVVKNLYFAGEILDIDAITGGYNLQAAWTTGFIAGKLLG
jgi:predicted Rossmann fold flavoprotein